VFTRNRARRHTARKVLFWGGSVALAMYLFDPNQGRTRRAKLADQLRAVIRRGTRATSQKAEHARGQLEGARHAISSDRPPENDAVLTSKVESEVLSRWNYPKGRISVNAADGIVELRGTTDTEDQIKDLERDVRKVTGVVDVHNYLHLPNTTPPNKQEAISAGRR
jgi:hyperosmotically inducible periplasmic protein